MSNPVDARRNLESLITHTFHLQQSLTLDDSPPSEEEHGLPALHRAAEASLAAEVVSGAVEFGAHGGPAALTTLGTVVAAPAIALGSCVSEWANAHAEGRHEAHRFEYERAVGALAYLEGRRDTSRRDTVEGRMRSDGYSAMEGAMRFAPETLAAARRQVAELRVDGYRAVIGAEDRGAAFHRRYHGDLVFKHAVDHARSLRAHEPARFEELCRAFSRPAAPSHAS